MICVMTSKIIKPLMKQDGGNPRLNVEFSAQIQLYNILFNTKLPIDIKINAYSSINKSLIIK